MVDRSPSFKKGQPPASKGSEPKTGKVKTPLKKINVQKTCEDLDIDPVKILAYIAGGKFNELHVPQSQLTLSARQRAATTLLEYSAPKKRSIDPNIEALKDFSPGGTGLRVVALPPSGRETIELQTQQEIDAEGIPILDEKP